jgi:biotin operon repressor
LYILGDGKFHTQGKLADSLEVSQRTIARAVDLLRYKYTIHGVANGEQL